jgi:hypothetical protein
MNADIKSARGFATSYLNRCNALFSKIFANRKTAVDEIHKLMTRQDGHSDSISDIRTLNLLTYTINPYLNYPQNHP